ncbi:hypothetical protein IFR05_005475 [Cadophora sp. M221]|nr:hypothetical protein IFR05_005475 [Cadophora sp. M221]
MDSLTASQLGTECEDSLADWVGRLPGGLDYAASARVCSLWLGWVRFWFIGMVPVAALSTSVEFDHHDILSTPQTPASDALEQTQKISTFGELTKLSGYILYNPPAHAHQRKCATLQFFAAAGLVESAPHDRQMANWSPGSQLALPSPEVTEAFLPHKLFPAVQNGKVKEHTSTQGREPTEGNPISWAVRCWRGQVLAKSGPRANSSAKFQMTKTQVMEQRASWNMEVLDIDQAGIWEGLA